MNGGRGASEIALEIPVVLPIPTEGLKVQQHPLVQGFQLVQAGVELVGSRIAQLG